MARRIPIVSISPSSVGVPGIFVVGATTDNASGNWEAVFQGKFYRQTASPFGTQAFYTAASAPTGYQLIEATQFEIVENASYAGRYTVYTPVGVVPPALGSSLFAGASTTVRVNEPIGAPITPGDASTGYVTNVSTYYIFHTGGASAVVIPPGVTVEQDGLEYVGRNFSGWGEVFNQNYAELLQNFASAVAPTPAAAGQLWFDTSAGLLKIYNAGWQVVNSAAFAPAASARVVGSGSTWTITHGLNAVAPFVVMCQFFVDVGAGVHKPILPSDVTFTNGNTLTATFSSAYNGYALVRL
jgi:hypothetical protein